MAAFVPFVVTGMLYVLVGGPALPAMVIFGLFVLLRLAHSVAYLREIQPWRTLAFVSSGLLLIGLWGQVAWRLFSVTAG